MVETGNWATTQPADIKQRIQDGASALPETEFSNVRKSANMLAADLFKRAKAEYLEKEAAKVTHALVSDLSKGTM